MDLLRDKDGKSATLQNFSNPFEKDGFNYVTFSFHKNKSMMFRENKRGEATVHFRKGNTQGRQEFYSDDFQDLVNQVDVFINSLK